MIRKKHIALVEYLADMVGCEFISDLPFEVAAGNPKVEMELRKIDPRTYSLRDWNDALEYLVHKSGQETVETAYLVLMQELQNICAAQVKE